MATFLALLMAFPFGWCFGLFIAFMVAGSNVGLLPIITIPVGIVASLIFAILPIYEPRTRLSVMLIGTPALYAFFMILPS